MWYWYGYTSFWWLVPVFMPLVLVIIYGKRFSERREKKKQSDRENAHSSALRYADFLLRRYDKAYDWKTPPKEVVSEVASAYSIPDGEAYSIVRRAAASVCAERRNYG